MTTLPPDVVFWTKVMEISETMDDNDSSLTHLQGLLCGLEEGISHRPDPVEAFPEFAALRLCRSLGRLLERLDDSKT